MTERQILERLIEAAMPFAAHDWYDAELEDDNCKLTRHSGTITVGDWRKLRHAVAVAKDAADGESVTDK